MIGIAKQVRSSIASPKLRLVINFTRLQLESTSNNRNIPTHKISNAARSTMHDIRLMNMDQSNTLFIRLTSFYGTRNQRPLQEQINKTTAVHDD
jgi:hypothetical protein